MGALEHLDSLAFVDDYSNFRASMNDGVHDVTALTRMFVAIIWKDRLEVFEEALLLEEALNLRRDALLSLFLKATDFLCLFPRLRSKCANSALIRSAARLLDTELLLLTSQFE